MPLDKLLSEGLRLVVLYSLSRLALDGQITPTQIFSFETSFSKVSMLVVASTRGHCCQKKSRSHARALGDEILIYQYHMGFIRTVWLLQVEDSVNSFLLTLKVTGQPLTSCCTHFYSTTFLCHVFVIGFQACMLYGHGLPCLQATILATTTIEDNYITEALDTVLTSTG